MMTKIALPPLPSMIHDGTALAHAVREYARQAVYAAQDDSSDVCQGCKGAGGTMTGGPCAECYGQGSYEAAREFIRSRGVEHDKRCAAALNLSDPCNCGSDDSAVKASREAFARYLKDCDENAIEPDAAGAFHWAWSNARSEPRRRAS